MSVATLPVLPACRWRGDEKEPGRYGCASPRLVVGPRGVRGETCLKHCPYVDQPAGAAITKAPSRGSCVHLGPPTGEVRSCASCGGSVRLKVMGCEIHGQCTVGRKIDGMASCVGCPDFKPAGS